MKKFSFLIVCLCAGLAFVSQAQDTERVAAGGEAPSLNGARPSPWERPGPGPRPIWYANGGSCSGDVTDDDCSGGSPLDGLEKGTVRPGTVLPNIKPGGDQTNGGLRPGVDHGPIVWAPSHESGGSSIVPDMADRLPNVNGDGTGAANFQRRPRDWDEPIPGPLPASLPDGWDIGKDGSHDADPLGSKGTIRPGSDPNVAPAGGDGPSLNSGRPSPWDRPGPRPGEHAMSTGDTGGSESGGSPLDDLEKGRLRPSGGSGDAVRAPQQGSSGSPIVADMVDHLLGGFKDVPDVNGDGKIDIADVTTLIDLLLEEE